MFCIELLMQLNQHMCEILHNLTFNLLVESREQHNLYIQSVIII